MSKRRTDLAIGVDYNTPLSEAMETLQQAVASIDGVLPEPPCEVDAVAFGDSSIDLLVRYWSTPQKRDVRKIGTGLINEGMGKLDSELIFGARDALSSM